jgi:HlyD family secretion protein
MLSALQLRRRFGPEAPVVAGLSALWGLTALWVLFWPVPTEVVGRGVVIVPGGASVLDSRAAGQILELPVAVGQSVRRGEPLVRFYLPTLEQQLRRQQRDLVELIRIDADLRRRDAARLIAAAHVRDIALAKLAEDRRRFESLRAVYDQKVADFRLLASRRVVAPLAQEVVSSEDRATQLDADLAELRIREQQAVDAWEAVKLAIDTEALQRTYRIADARRGLRVTEARLAYEGTLRAPRPGRLIDIQVVTGQTVKPGERLGTLAGSGGQPLQAVAYFAPADARRLRPGMAVEVVPDWNERGRFGGIRGRVERLNLLPASREDVDTTLGNPQLAESLVRHGPVIRSEIALVGANAALGDAGGRSQDFHWTLSRGSSVFPIHQGLTLKAHAYVEWRSPVSYLLPVLRDLTGSYRTLGDQRREDQPVLRQQGALP